MKRLLLIILFLSLIFSNLKSQDTLNYNRALPINLGFDAVCLTSGYLYLNKAWYQGFERTKMHWFDDSREWNGVDKIGHAFSSFHFSKLYAYQFKLVGLDNPQKVILGSLLGFSTISMIELLDAKSSHWGASWADLLANTLGTSFFMFQDLLWEKTKIDFKFSYHHTQYAQYRPVLLGKNNSERFLKDYNGQTYWISTSPNSFGVEWWPSVLNIAMGYGAEGMTSAEVNSAIIVNPYFERNSQFYLSLDINLTKIKTSKKWLKTLFEVVNVIKIPMPTIELRDSRFYGHLFYF